MRIPAAAILSTVFLLNVPVAFAEVRSDVRVQSDSGDGEASANVRIENRVNSRSSTTTGASSTGSTSVEISQTGEGTSTVNVNGKEWKVEGPGDLSVREGTSTQDPQVTVRPTKRPTPTPVATGKPAPSPTARIIEGFRVRIGGFSSYVREFFRFIFR